MSRSTVDRVLNQRPGVKPATVKAVNKAIEEIGFERNLSAANLARNRVYRFMFLLPKAPGDFLTELERQATDLARSVKSEGIEISTHRVLEPDQHRTVEYLARIRAEECDGVAIFAYEGPQVRDALVRLAERGVHVVRLISRQQDSKAIDFVGIDNVAAGQTAARLLGSLSGSASGNVVVVTDTMSSPDSASRRHGFDQVLQSRFPAMDALPTLETYGDPARTFDVLQKSFENFPQMAGIYVMNSEAGNALKSIDRLTPDKAVAIVAHERTSITLSQLTKDKISALIVQDPGHVVRSAARKLRAKCDKRGLLAAQDEIRIEILLKENLPNQHLARMQDA